MPTNYVQIIPGTIGGTQAAYTLWLAGGAGGGGVDGDGDPTTSGLPHFWWNDVTNPSGAAGTPGPILNAALSTINKIQLYELPTYIEFNLGQTDTGAFDTTLNSYEIALDPTAARAIFVDAMVQIVATVRAAISARSVALGGPAIPASALPCWLHPLGRRFGQPGPLGWEFVRQAQYAAQRAIPFCYPGPETYHAELHDGLHNAATGAGQIEQGLAGADCQLIDAYGRHSFTDSSGVVRKIRRGPAIGTVTKVDAYTLQIQIVPEDPSDTILYPTGVLGPSPLNNALPNWRFCDSATPITSDGTYLPNGLADYANAITATGFTVDVNNLMTVALAAPIPNTPVVYYPFDNLPDFTAVNGVPCYIREASTGRPLNGLFRG